MTVEDLEGVLRVPWNPPFKDKLVPKNLLDLALHARQKSMRV